MKKSQKPPKRALARRDALIADSLKQAAAMLGYELATVKAAKDAGCPAIKHGRVYIAEMQQWVIDNPGFERRDMATLTLAHVELRNEVTKLLEREQKLYERRKLFCRGEDVKRSLVKSWLAMKVKLHGMAVKLSQPLALMNEARMVQKTLDAEHCAVLSQIERGEWFDANEAAKWLATQPEILAGLRKLKAI